MNLILYPNNKIKHFKPISARSTFLGIDNTCNYRYDHIFRNIDDKIGVIRCSSSIKNHLFWEYDADNASVGQDNIFILINNILKIVNFQGNIIKKYNIRFKDIKWKYIDRTGLCLVGLNSKNSVTIKNISSGGIFDLKGKEYEIGWNDPIVIRLANGMLMYIEDTSSGVGNAIYMIDSVNRGLKKIITGRDKDLLVVRDYAVFKNGLLYIGIYNKNDISFEYKISLFSNNKIRSIAIRKNFEDFQFLKTRDVYIKNIDDFKVVGINKNHYVVQDIDLKSLLS